MVFLADLPTFAYTIPRPTTRKNHIRHHPRGPTATATCLYRGKNLQVRHTLRNTISPRKWRNIAAPPYWPASLAWPLDIPKSLLYNFAALQRNRKASPQSSPTPRVLSSLSHCYGIACPMPHTRAPSVNALCACTAAPWDTHNTHAWTASNIALEHANATLGIRTVAARPFAAGTVLAEYLGEVIPRARPAATSSSSSSSTKTPASTAYLFDLGADSAHAIPACIDAQRVGNWTRFINHSCRSNAVFALRRVGAVARVCVVLERDVAAGEEVTVDYERGFWEVRRRLGVYCACGEVGCRYKQQQRRRGRGRLEKKGG